MYKNVGKNKVYFNLCSMIFSKSKVLTLQFSENQWLETKIAKLEEDHKKEIAKLREEISKLENALTAHQNLQSSGEYLRIKQQAPDFPCTSVFDILLCMKNWDTQISMV